MRRRADPAAAAACAALLGLATAGAALAQDVSIQSITAGLDFGAAVSADGGATVFRAAASTGAVTRIGGTGYRITNSPARALVTVACGSDSACEDTQIQITVAAVGSPSGRAGALDNFTVHPATAEILSGPTGTNPVVFTIAPIGANATRSFHLGADLPILGDDSGAPTGFASSSFLVTAAPMSEAPSSDAGGQALATVYRPLSLNVTSSLSFGTIIRPPTGQGTVAIDAATGDRLLGGGVEAIGPAPARGAFAVAGEGGQSFSVAVPSGFAMAGPGDPIEVTLSHDAAGPQMLSGAAGGGGTAEIHVGGAFDVPASVTPGTYSGVFTVTVQYE